MGVGRIQPGGCEWELLEIVRVDITKEGLEACQARSLKSQGLDKDVEMMGFQLFAGFAVVEKLNESVVGRRNLMLGDRLFQSDSKKDW